MYLYASEHALMDYHLTPKEGVELPELPVAETKEDETNTTETKS